MTAGRFGAVDFDLLADYLGGVLDGTPDETVVSRLISEDPEWSRAYAELTPAVKTVRQDLAALGAAPTAMPTDVTDRIAAALRAADPVGPATPLVAVPGEGRTAGGPDTLAARRRRRWSRLAGPVAVAAAVAALGGFGVSRLLGAADNSRTASAPDAAAPASGSSAATRAGSGATTPEDSARALLAPVAGRPIVSGTNYTTGSLAATIDDLAKRSTPAAKAGPAAASADGRLRAPGGLVRLTDPTALTTCLDAVAGEHADGPVTVELLDYASFDGNPALVILFTDGNSARWAWVAGPECGVPGSGADTRYTSRVG